MKIWYCEECNEVWSEKPKQPHCPWCKKDFKIADTDDRQLIVEFRKQLLNITNEHESKHCENHNKYESWCPQCIQRESDAIEYENDLMRVRIKQQDERIAELEKQHADYAEELRVLARGILNCARHTPIMGPEREVAHAALKEGE